MVKSAVNGLFQLPGLLGAGVAGLEDWKKDEASRKKMSTDRPALSFAESGTVESYRQQAAIRKQSENVERKQLTTQQQMLVELKKQNGNAVVLKPMNLARG